MSVSESLLPEFDQEMANTRKVLERIPGDKLDWQVHEKSNTIGWVGIHLAEIPGWIEMTLKQNSVDIAPPGGEDAEGDVGVSAVVPAADGGGDPTAGVELLDDEGSGAPGVLHQQALGDVALLLGLAIDVGHLGSAWQWQPVDAVEVFHSQID